MREIISVIGLILQLNGSFLLAARGFTSGSLRRVWLINANWFVVCAPGIFCTSALFWIDFAKVDLISKHRSVTLILVSLLAALAWIPSLAKYAEPYVDAVDFRVSDLEIEKLNVRGFALLGAGFIAAAIGTVL